MYLVLKSLSLAPLLMARSIISARLENFLQKILTHSVALFILEEIKFSNPYYIFIDHFAFVDIFSPRNFQENLIRQLYL